VFVLCWDKHATRARQKCQLYEWELRLAAVAVALAEIANVAKQRWTSFNSSVLRCRAADCAATRAALEAEDVYRKRPW
jgi:hypothetical protein